MTKYSKEATALSSQYTPQPKPYVAWEPRKGKLRNTSCECGSGLKYKKCCLHKNKR